MEVSPLRALTQYYDNLIPKRFPVEMEVSPLRALTRFFVSLFGHVRYFVEMEVSPLRALTLVVEIRIRSDLL